MAQLESTGDRSRAPRRGRLPRALPLVALALAAAGCGRPLEARSPGPEPGCRQAKSVEEGARAPGELRWVVPPDDRPVLDEWCRGVGSPVYRAMPPGPDGGPADSVAIVSWNTHVGGGDLVRLVSDLRAGRLTGGTPVRHFALLLQEVHRAGAAIPARAPERGVPARVEAHPDGARRTDVVEAGRALGLSLLYVPSMRNGHAPPGGTREDRGNAILSTLPLHDPGAVELPFEAQRRVAVAATLRGTTGEGAPWELLVSSTHLDTRSTGARFWATFGAGRRRQAEALVEALPAGLPAVVAGDLNTWSLASLEGSLPFLRSAFPQTPCPGDEPTFATGWGFSRRLDHLFFRLPQGWGARYRRVDERYGSDHFPLLAWATIESTPEGPRNGSATGTCE